MKIQSVAGVLDYVAACEAGGIRPLADKDLSQSENGFWSSAELAGYVDFFDGRWRLTDMGRAAVERQ